MLETDWTPLVGFPLVAEFALTSLGLAMALGFGAVIGWFGGGGGGFMLAFSFDMMFESNKNRLQIEMLERRNQIDQLTRQTDNVILFQTNVQALYYRLTFFGLGKWRPLMTGQDFFI